MNRCTSRYLRLLRTGLFPLLVAFGFLQAAALAQTPTISTLVPNNRPAGSPGFTLTVLGTNFNSTSVVQWNGTSRTTTPFPPGSSTQLEAVIPAADVASPGTAEVRVVNTPGGSSEILPFAITGTGPTISSLSPNSAQVGGPAFTLTVTGNNLTSNSTVQWNGSNRPTTFVSDTRLTAAIPATDIAQAGTASITVITGSLVSNALIFRIEAFLGLYFAQVAVGAGFSTVVTVINTGATTGAGTLTFTDPSGSPLTVNLIDPSVVGSSFAISVPPGAARTFTVTGVGVAELRTGWARIDGTSGTLNGVSTIQFSEGGVLRSLAAVLASRPVESATIPVDSDDTQSRFPGVAIANPSDENINIRIVLIDEGGTTVGNTDLSLLPRRQVSRFLHEFFPTRIRFRGTMVLVAQAGRRFVAVALVLNQGLLTAVPVVPEKPVGVPN